MIYCFDLDGTLCTNTNGDYYNAKPFIDRINKLNDLYNLNNKIIINNFNKTVKTKNMIHNKLTSVWGCKIDLNKNLSSHIGRHTFATRALTKGISIDKVSKLLGHSAIRETQIYAKIICKELDNAMDVFND